MSTPYSADVLAAFRDFVTRLDELDPQAPVAGELTVGLGDATERLALRLPVARALTEALRGYHDPRERGTCAHCAGRLDDDFVCRNCGIVNGLFGQTLAGFAARSEPAEQDPELDGPRALPSTAGLDGTLGD